jgi:AraC-like DNA-binding protein
MLREDPNDANLSAETCAEAVGLSASRLCHLFREETGIAFRSCKMWRRARRFLDQAKGDAGLTDVALGLGYPDSSHFSHSIRRTFCMQLGAIRAGSRNMVVWPGADYRRLPRRLCRENASTPPVVLCNTPRRWHNGCVDPLCVKLIFASKIRCFLAL